MMKKIVVTGGTSGVGLSIAKDLAIDNHVIIIGRDSRKGEIQAEKLGDNVTFIQTDLSQVDNGNELLSQLSDKLGVIDVLVLSAGVFPKNKNDNISNNLVSHYNTVMKLMPLLRNGRVLQVSGNPQAVSILPICERQLNAIERASWLITHKTLLMVYLSHVLQKYHIKVNSFFPGDVQSNLMPYTKALHNTDVPVGRYLALNESLSEKNGVFFDKNGQEIYLDKDKYSFENAKLILSQYIKLT
mgnify:CR=1 FL=1